VWENVGTKGKKRLKHMDNYFFIESGNPGRPKLATAREMVSVKNQDQRKQQDKVVIGEFTVGGGGKL